MQTASIRVLLNGLVDFAGLFPPAKLDMTRAVETYARHRAGPHAYGLARFILPVSRLPEFSTAARALLPDLDLVPAGAGVPSAMPVRAQGAAAGPTPAGLDTPPEPWTLSVLIDGPVEESLRAIEQFNREHYRNHHYSAVVDTVEIKVAAPESIEYAMDLLPEELWPFFEIPLAHDPRGFAAALAGLGAGAKARTGGVTPELFPTIDQLADFIAAMAAADVPFKATAGLHHPVRGPRPLTYEPHAPSHVMHGFVNLFLGAALFKAEKIDRAGLADLLAETDPAAFVFSDEGVTWRNTSLSTKHLAELREDFAICYGCCSFDDPINGLSTLRRAGRA